MPSAKFASFALVAALLTVAAQPVSGFVRTKTCDSYGTYACDPGESPEPIFWPVRCVEYRINAAGSSQLPSGPEGGISRRVRDEVVEAFRVWNRPDCSDFQMLEGPLTNETKSRYREGAGFRGNTNLVVWRDETWPYGGNQGDVFALTKVRYSASGRIRDADIEINSATFEFAILEESRRGDSEAPVDLRNSLTHEAGHVLGLAHPSVEEATMYGQASPGEINKRTLESDDIEGLCAIYPAQSPPATCDEPEDFVPDDDGGGSGRPGRPCGCASSESRPGGLLVLFVAAIAIRSHLRRRKSERA